MSLNGVSYSSQDHQINKPASKNNISFSARKSQVASANTVSGGAEYSFRVLANKFNDFFETKGSKKITNDIAALTPKQDKVYLAQLAEIGRIYGSKKIINVNIEDEILEKIAKKGDSTIFIMNHSNQSEDPQMLAVLNTLLSEAYKKNNCETFPLPKIILNEDILKTMNPTRRKAFENFGAVGIDASVVGGDKAVNARAFFPIMKDFVKNNCNIFIFPEGRLAVRKDLNLFNRFQPGVASMISRLLSSKKEITVVPVAFAYGSGDLKNLNSMQIGTPIEIKRDDDLTTVTKGDIEKDKNSVLYNFFDKNKGTQDVVLTSQGKPVGKNDVADYLKTILCENLEINSKLAKEKLAEAYDETDVQIC